MLKLRDSTEKTTLLSAYDLSMPANDSPYHWAKIPVTLVPGETYQVDFDAVSVRSGQTDRVSVLVFDWTENKIVRHQIFDVENCNQNGGASWAFTVPSDGDANANYQLLAYAGVHGNTTDIGVEYSGISVYGIE